MNPDFSPIGLNLPYWVFIAAGCIIAFIITWISIPTIVKISKFKKLYGIPNERTSHIDETPNLGGLAVFAGFVIAAIIFSMKPESDDIKFILGAIIVLFFTGLKDDILVIDPKKKLLGQIIAASIIVIFGNIRITSFYHTFGVEEISYILSVLFTIFLVVVLINGFNLIDGVDGLASGAGIITSLAFGIWFILTKHTTYAVLCFSLTGSLIAFFRFNVFGRENKIFLGDTGSMITGLIVAVFTIKFLEFQQTAPVKYQFHSAPALAFGLLISPLFDTARVFILRIFNGSSPFKADRNHLHHSLLALGNSHLKSTIIILSCNLLFVLLAAVIQKVGNVILIIILTLLAVTLSFLPRMIMRLREKKSIISTG
ncbi:MAG: undecaprenyl/decaprenyl-phosphate alpha-N-acetylglucosaminyl 1-phosphate transferase [Bacteroidales bacterium]|nr:undecaprenyl/decaprenyl-phosphate alpha-N-acetylglucosaminyl 1-phosphate transferase [Bacteroidales bacterium]